MPMASSGLRRLGTWIVQKSIEQSDVTQQEDMWVSELVQTGLGSPAYDQSRYAAIEKGTYHFHQLLAADLRSAL